MNKIKKGPNWIVPLSVFQVLLLTVFTVVFFVLVFVPCFILALSIWHLEFAAAMLGGGVPIWLTYVVVQFFKQILVRYNFLRNPTHPNAYQYYG